MIRYGNLGKLKRFDGPAITDPRAKKGTPRTPDVANPDAFKSAEFEYDGFSIGVTFHQGKSAREEYRRIGAKLSEKLDDKDVEALLQANSNGKKWTQIEIHPHGRGWVREDGAQAGFTENHAFFIWDGGKLRAAERAEKENKATAPTGF